MSQSPEGNDQSSAPRELYRLMSAWAENVLTDAEFAQLDALLRESPSARLAFSRYVRICQSLPDLVVPAFGPTQIDRLEAASPRANVTARTLSLFRGLMRQPWMIATSLLVVLLAGATAFSLRGKFSRNESLAVEPLPDDGGLEQPADGPSIIPATRVVDSHLAVVTRTQNLVWEPDSPAVESGAALESQVLKVASGILEIEFECGACVRLRGPAEFALISKSRGKLNWGALAAHVPEAAHGFAIDTPTVEVVDLGTEFGVHVARSGISDVHVFRGLVETRIPSRDDQPGSLERLAADQTRRFSPQLSKSEVLSFDKTKYPAAPERYLDEPTTQGAICLLREPPKSLAVGALESNDFILLIEERQNVPLPRPIPVSLSLPGRYDRFKGKDGKLRPPLRVDSYLLHFDALTTPQNYYHLRLDGSVTFPRPILGVIAAGPALTLTDGLFGYPDVVQSDARARGLDRNAKGNSLDVVTLSEDRRTLHVSFSVGGSCDQLRILIAAEQQPNEEQK